MRSFLHNQNGQTTVLFALMLFVICTAIGLAVDIGWYAYKQAKIQDSADLAALSGAHHLPLNPATATTTALDVFAKNYGSLTPIQNINYYNSNSGMKVHFEENIPLFFMRVVGINEVTVAGKAEAEVHYLSQPAELIPVGIFHTTPLVYGVNTMIYGDDYNTRGNFGIVDLSGIGIISGSSVEFYIAKGYSASDGPMPKAGDRIPTLTGRKAGPVHKGFNTRITEGRTTVICPVIDFTKASGSSNRVPILGFARFEALSTTLSGVGTNEYVEVWGKFVEMIDPRAITSPSAGYYGVKSIKLVK